jgi:tRNA pseudouridine55 synthase
MNGAININKPTGPTSHDIVLTVRKLLTTHYSLPTIKVGHAGTLDPFASGVLLILVGSATRLVEYIHLLPKTYAAHIVLGATSDTDDPTGKITPPG